MIECNRTENRIILKGNTAFLAVGTVTTFMAIMGVRLLFGLLPLTAEHTFTDVIGVLIACVWILLTLGISIPAFVTNSKQIIIDNEGILYSNRFVKRKLKWAEIEDWGLSYCGKAYREGRNTYFLYFSKERQPIKNECKKKLKGKMIKTLVIGNDYYNIMNDVIHFCSLRTEVKPFIGKDKLHFI